jgi:hypothetical protein
MKRYRYIVIALCCLTIVSGLTAAEDIKFQEKIEHSLRSAKIAMNAGDTKKALHHLERCLELDPENQEANLLLAKVIAKLAKLQAKDALTAHAEFLPPKEERHEIAEEELPAVQESKPKGDRATILWEDFEGSWGPYGDDPPAGWTIIDNGDEATPTWNTNDWYNYAYSGQGQVARVYYSPSENQEEWLITPTLNVPTATCSLKFWHYYWDCSSGDSAYVLGSINDGASWTDTIALFNSDHFGQDTAFDITSWASGQSQAKLAFLYYGNYDWYWMVDECSVATYVTYQYDVGVTAILQPPDSVPRSRRNWTPRARLHNYGTDRVRNFDVVCTFQSNNSYLDTFTVSSWFNSGEDLIVDFAGWNPHILGTDTMTVWHDVADDGDRSNDTLINEVKIVQAFFTGGPDGYGYSWVDSDTIEHPNVPIYSWINSNGGTALGLGDDATVNVALPFPFRYYENVYNDIWICSNGFVNFGSSGYSSLGNGSIPNTTTPNNAIYAYWDDLDPTEGGEIYYKTISGPNRFVIIWDDIYHNAATGQGISFEIVLYENGSILMQYADVNFGSASYSYGRSATVGMENANGTIGLEYLYDWNPYGNLLLPQRAIDWPCNDVPSAPTIYPLYIDLDGNFPIYWTKSIDRDGIAGYQLDEVAPDTLLYDPCVAGNFNLVGFSRSNTRFKSEPRSYGSRNVSTTYDTMISVNSYNGAETVEFWWWGGIESFIDDAYFDISIDNQASWINMGYYTGNDSTWYHENVDVSAYSGYDIYLRYRYVSDGSLNYGGFWVDDILVNGWQWVQTFSSSIPDTTYNITGASNGWHYYRVRGQDNVSNWGYWSAIEDIWIGPNDAPTITVESPASPVLLLYPQHYAIKWTDSDPDNNATIALYYDTDNTGYDGTLITGGISEDDPADSFVWNMPAPAGPYYIYARIDDGINAPCYDYSSGTVATLGTPVCVQTDWLAMYISNDFSIDNDPGTYTAATAAGHPYGVDVTLLYDGEDHNPWSSYNTIRSKQTNTDYVTRTSGAESNYTVAQLGDYYSRGTYLDNLTVLQEYDVVNGQDNFLIKQVISAEGGGDNSRLRISLKLINRSGQARDFSFRYEWDVHVDLEDSPACRAYFSSIPGPWEVVETQWNLGGKAIPLSLEESEDSLPGPAAFFHFLSAVEPSTATPPDTLYYVCWGNSTAYDSAFEVPYADNGIDTLCGDWDAAVCYMWVDETVPSGDSITFTQYLLVSNPALSVELTEFAASYNRVSNEVRLAWETASEEDNLGFNLYRAIDNGEYAKINDELIPGAGNSSSPKQYTFADCDITKVGLYSYKLEQVNAGGATQMHGPATIDIRNFIPRISLLNAIYPNPFSCGIATVSFAVGLQDAGEQVTLGIYDISGRLVRTLIQEKRDAGFYSETWDGRNYAGRKVSSGVYYMVLQAGTTKKVQKAVLLK